MVMTGTLLYECTSPAYGNREKGCHTLGPQEGDMGGYNGERVEVGRVVGRRGPLPAGDRGGAIWCGGVTRSGGVTRCRSVTWCGGVTRCGGREPQIGENDPGRGGGRPQRGSNTSSLASVGACLGASGGRNLEL